jgi:hypothetical protein
MVDRWRKDEALSELVAFYAEIDRRVAALTERHGSRLHCRLGCADCCVDGITVFEVEAAHIWREMAPALARERPHPPGACAFLDATGGCRIYAVRPYVCRTQGLPLRWLEAGELGQTVERRDICPLNEEGPPLLSLPQEACWTLGPSEGRLRRIQERLAGGRLGRVFLRDVFLAGRARSPDGTPDAPARGGPSSTDPGQKA